MTLDEAKKLKPGDRIKSPSGNFAKVTHVTLSSVHIIREKDNRPMIISMEQAKRCEIVQSALPYAPGQDPWTQQPLSTPEPPNADFDNGKLDEWYKCGVAHQHRPNRTLSETKCTCGTAAIMGEIEAKYHSDWCELREAK